MVNVCTKEFLNVGLLINYKKTFCVRIGPRHSIKPLNITVNSNTIEWTNELAYLGLFIVSAKNFKINIQNKKQKFFRALNGILGKIGIFSSPQVVLSLVESYCVPVLLYGLESVELPKSVIRSIENAYFQVYNKLFHTFDRDVVKQCQFYLNYLPAELKLVSRKLNFYQDTY